MNQEEIVLRSNLIREIRSLTIVMVILVIIMKIIFYRDDFISTTRLGLSLFWLFVLPGYAILYYWKDKIIFAERIAVGAVLAAGFMAISSYYLGLAGVHIKYHGIILPVIMLIIAAILSRKKF